MKNINTPLYILFTLVIITIILIFIKNNNIRISEGFTKESGYLEGCPPGFKTYTISNGDTMCCDGEIIGDKCMGATKCVLSSKRSGDAEPCINLMTDINKVKAKDMCPTSMGTYFVDKKKNSACTSEILNKTRDGLAAPNRDSRICYIYKDDMSKFAKDSCYNYKELEKIECFGKSCIKGIEQIEPNIYVPVIKFTTSNGLVLTTVPKKVMEDVIKYTNTNFYSSPTYKDFINNSPIVMENAKAYFVDRTRDFNNY